MVVGCFGVERLLAVPQHKAHKNPKTLAKLSRSVGKYKGSYDSPKPYRTPNPKPSPHKAMLAVRSPENKDAPF